MTRQRCSAAAIAAVGLGDFAAVDRALPWHSKHCDHSSASPMTALNRRIATPNEIIYPLWMWRCILQLHIAAANGYFKVAEFLLGHDVTVDCVDNDTWQPVHCAACWGQVSRAMCFFFPVFHFWMARVIRFTRWAFAAVCYWYAPDCGVGWMRKGMRSDRIHAALNVSTPISKNDLWNRRCAYVFSCRYWNCCLSTVPALMLRRRMEKLLWVR